MLVTFGTQGWVTALIFVGILILETQIGSHLLQALIMGRYVQLHPLGIGLALAVGTMLGGIVGAVIAVPIAAVLYRALPVLFGSRAGAPRAPTPGRAARRRRNPVPLQ